MDSRGVNHESEKYFHLIITAIKLLMVKIDVIASNPEAHYTNNDYQ